MNGEKDHITVTV